ncbi:EF-hand domain-containing family member B [Drosophila santomea]|uniref:EF-hand domain-containing family member B n=1 Tax=Drosophila santomea TaxID=129105 RepID=UPI0019538232|nr:EF-hand domain-containing family member B [Drosophila santomea]
MANIGRYIERNPGMRAAGLASTVEFKGAKDCLFIVSSEEEAENRIMALCRRSRPKPAKRTPKLPTNQMGDILNNQNQGLFAEFQNRFRENMFVKKPALGQPKEANSKPSYVTNLSHTFGKIADPNSIDSLYSIVLPPKPAEQVNREYAEFHDKHIISHNHYFPAEQINRRYSQPFSRFNTFGLPASVDPSGIKVKRCLEEGEEHLKIVKKPQKDIDDRTKGPLGKKYSWYPYQIPENMTFGRVLPRDTDVRSLLEYTSPSVKSENLASAVSHLNMLRKLLQERDDFNMNQVIVALGKKDKEGHRQLPLDEIIKVLHKLSIPADAEKIRNAMSHFRLFVDEGCCSEKVKYEELCDLLTILKSLPLIGSITPMPKVIYTQDTAYRQLCADLMKKPPEGPHFKQPHKTPIQQDMDDTRVGDVINPEISTLCGLWPSDFKALRSKDELERIFKDLVTHEGFQTIWLSLMDEQKDQSEMASVAQFRAQMKKATQ